MTLQELYSNIGGDYDQAIRVLRMDKLIDKHIRKLPKNGVIDALLQAGETMDPTQLFETAHAVKGVCANLGLNRIAALASEITENYRPGVEKSFSDEEIEEKLKNLAQVYQQTAEGIALYEASLQ